MLLWRATDFTLSYLRTLYCMHQCLVKPLFVACQTHLAYFTLYITETFISQTWQQWHCEAQACWISASGGMIVIQALVNPHTSLCLFHKCFIFDTVTPRANTECTLSCRRCQSDQRRTSGACLHFSAVMTFLKWPLFNVPFLLRMFLWKQGRVDPLCFCFCHKATHCVRASEWQGVMWVLVYVGPGSHSRHFLLSKTFVKKVGRENTKGFRYIYYTNIKRFLSLGFFLKAFIMI